MVDIQERKRMVEAILSLLACPLKWDAFDQYYSRVKTEDAAVYDIGWFFWVCLDPEFPSNQDSLSTSSSFRAILFLLSALEYQQRLKHQKLSACSGDEYWPFSDKTAYEGESMANCKYVEGLLAGISG